MHLIHSISPLLPQGSPGKMFPRGGGLLGVTSAAVDGPQPRSPRLTECPSMKEPRCASCSVPPAWQVYSRCTGHGGQRAAPVRSQQLPFPPARPRGVIAGLLPCAASSPGPELAGPFKSPSGAVVVGMTPTPAPLKIAKNIEDGWGDGGLGGDGFQNHGPVEFLPRAIGLLAEVRHLRRQHGRTLPP